MPKRKKYPKKPKMSASLDVWKRWEEKAKRVKQHNDKIDAARKQKEKIKNKY